MASPFVLTSLFSFLLSGVLHGIYAISMRLAFKGATDSLWERWCRAHASQPSPPASHTHFLSAPLSPQKALFPPSSAHCSPLRARMGRNVGVEIYGGPFAASLLMTKFLALGVS